MSIGDILKAGDWKKVVLALYEEYIYPALSSYVEKTENEYDDAALGFADKFLRDFLDDAE